MATFDCTVEREIEAGDHTMVLLRLHAVEDGGAGSPLVFHRSGFERLDARTPTGRPPAAPLPASRGLSPGRGPGPDRPMAAPAWEAPPS